MVIKQLSVFLENREGRLEKVAETLGNNHINIVSISLADTTEYGMLRMIVSDPVKGKTVLKEAGFSAMMTDVIAIKLPQKVGVMHSLLKLLVSQEISVEYMYTLATGKNASVVVKLSNALKAIELLTANGYELFRAEDAYQINCDNSCDE